MTTEITFPNYIGEKISIDGYIYVVERQNRFFFTLKFRGIDKEENRPPKDRFRMKKDSMFRIGKTAYKVIGATAAVWFKVVETKEK